MCLMWVFVYTVFVLVYVIFERLQTNPPNQMGAIIPDNPIETSASPTASQSSG